MTLSAYQEIIDFDRVLNEISTVNGDGKEIFLKDKCKEEYELDDDDVRDKQDSD